jgi:4,5-dihydroxyphthalate decarboxylase
VASAQRVLGRDYWTYGLDGNEEALATITRYAFEQGLVPEPYPPRDLFAPETLEDTVI